MTSSKCNRQRGGCCEWDLSEWNEWTVDHEISLCSQILYGTYISRYDISLESMIEKAKIDKSKLLQSALKTWQSRYDRALEEKTHRILLGEWSGTEAPP